VLLAKGLGAPSFSAAAARLGGRHDGRNSQSEGKMLGDIFWKRWSARLAVKIREANEKAARNLHG